MQVMNGQRHKLILYRQQAGFFDRRMGKKHGRKLSDAEMRFILKNYGGQCAVTGICNTNAKPLDFHHIVPPENGGTNAPSNFCPITPQAHRRVHQVIKAMLNAGMEPVEKTFIAALQYVQKEYWAALLKFYSGKMAPESIMHREPKQKIEHPLTGEQKLLLAVLLTLGMHAREKQFRRFLRALRRDLYRQQRRESEFAA